MIISWSSCFFGWHSIRCLIVPLLLFACLLFPIIWCSLLWLLALSSSILTGGGGFFIWGCCLASECFVTRLKHLETKQQAWRTNYHQHLPPELQILSIISSAFTFFTDKNNKIELVAGVVWVLYNYEFFTAQSVIFVPLSMLLVISPGQTPMKMCLLDLIM